MVDFENPFGGVVEEVPIVSNRYDSAGVVLQEALEPCNRLGIEMVGGLVEQQQVGAREQKAGKRDTAAFATGQVGDLGITGRKAKGVACNVDGSLQVPRLGGFDSLFEVCLTVAKLFEVGVGV